jgi:hypothetical protein
MATTVTFEIEKPARFDLDFKDFKSVEVVKIKFINQVQVDFLGFQTRIIFSNAEWLKF